MTEVRLLSLVLAAFLCATAATAVDLQVEKTVDVVRPPEGDPVTFTVTVTNDGPGMATGVVVTDLLPSGLSCVSGVGSQGTYACGTGVWDVGTLSEGASASLDLLADFLPGPGDPTGTGTFLDTFAISPGFPQYLVFGPDGNLYVSDLGLGQILRYDGTTGALIDVFVDIGGGASPLGLTFGPDGNLYVGRTDTSEVLRYDGTTGAFIDVFVSAGSGGLAVPLGLAFGPDGNFYVASFASGEVLRYDGATGAFIDAFVAAGSAGPPSGPTALAFGVDGNLYLAQFRTGEVLRYDGATGAALGAFVTSGSGGLTTPAGLVFGPDGHLYVTLVTAPGTVLRYDGATGSFLGVYVKAGGGGLSDPLGLVFGPDGHLYVASSTTGSVLRYDGFVTNTASLTSLDQTDTNPLNDRARQGVDGEKLDFGDAPDPGYPTLVANDGARHVGVSSVFLGTRWDGETDGQPDAAATGDDLAGHDDDDGVTFTTPLAVGQSASVQVTANLPGRLNAWIDFDQNGSWLDAGEQIAADRLLAAGANTLTFTVPAGASLGSTFARFRFDSAGGLGPTGLAADGEVEDYQTPAVEPPPALSLSKSDAGASGVSGGTVVYTLSVTNSGVAGAVGVRFTETVPANATFNAAASSPGWSCADGSPAATVCTVALAATLPGGGGMAAVSFAVRVVDPLPAGVTEISNSATVDATNAPAPATAGDMTPVTPSDTIPPVVVAVDSVPATGGGLTAGEVTTVAISAFLVSFSEPMQDPPGDTGADDVTNPANYLLVEAGANGVLDTGSCAAGVAPDDVAVAIAGVTYDAPSLTAIVDLGGPLPPGVYQLLVCGTATLRDLAGNPLGGGLDFPLAFRLARVAEIPALGTLGGALLALLLTVLGASTLRRLGGQRPGRA